MCITACFFYVSAWKTAKLIFCEVVSEYFIGLCSAFGDTSGYFPVDFSDSDTGLEGSKTLGDAETVLIN